MKDIGSIREGIDLMAERMPEKEFLISPETGRSVTFRALQQQSLLLCNLLRQGGLEPGDKAAFLMDNGLAAAQLFLGTMYGGFVAVPLNVRAGVVQLSYMLDHCDAKTVFVEEEYTSLLQEALGSVRRDLRVIVTDANGPLPVDAANLERMPVAAPLPGDVALLMYSSGSTGKPKGAIHTHSSVLAHGWNSIVSHQLTAADRSLLVLPLYHINAECVTLVPTLLSGGSVLVAHRFVVSKFWDWVEDFQVTWSALVPTIISELVDWDDPGKEHRQAAFQRIRFLRSSSAPLAPTLHQQFLDKFHLPLLQAMGSTEAGNVFSNPQPPGKNKIGSPGLPWGFETRIADRDGVDVPPGESGEVLLRGAALMRGYYKDPEGTAAVVDSQGWLHTGDLARRDEDGYFFIVGRSKELIIKGGVNIAPRQIDDVLESHPAVLEAAAVGVPDRYFGEDAVAFVVLRSSTGADEKALLAYCETRLGHFKTPSRIHFLKALPKGPSGKVQRLRLLDPAVLEAVAATALPDGEAATLNGNGTGNHGDGVAAPLQQIIASAWEEVLSIPEVDGNTNFFALGGHSLLAIQCLSKLRNRLPIMLSLADFFENPTVAEQTELVRQRLRPSNGAAPHPADEKSDGWEQSLLQQFVPPSEEAVIPSLDPSIPHPLSPGQQGLWFVHQMNPEVPVYNEGEAVRLTGPLNVDALECALNMIVDRQDVLRSTVELIDGIPHAVVHEHWPVHFKRIDLSALSADRREAEVDRLLIDEPRIPYDLETEPGFRVTLLRLSAHEHVLILMMHHIAGDWSSEGILWRELSVLYRSLLSPEPPVLPALPIRYGDYSVWQQKRLATADFSEDLAYWEETLRGAPPLLELPADHPRPPVMSYRGDRIRWKLNRTLSESLRKTSRVERTSLFTIFAAALDTLLYRYSGAEDILVGIPLADRDVPGLQALIGYLLRVHVLRTQLSGNMTFHELLSRVQKAALDLYLHRAVPFDQIVQRLQPERNLSYTPVFQVMLNWRDREQMLSFIGLEGLAVDSLMAFAATSKFDLVVQATDLGDEIWLELEYNTDIFKRERIERLLLNYQTLLEAVARDTSMRLAEMPLLSAEERRQVVFDWNRTTAEYPSDKRFHELFEEQAARAPEAAALVFDQTQLTYGELNRRANRLAHLLREMGVKPDDRVAISFERGMGMIAALLAVMKAGGAYVPLDPAYPIERLRFMLSDSGAGILLTQQNLKERFEGGAKNLRVIDAECEMAGRRDLPDANLDCEEMGLSPRHLAYVIYTSGSTGTPKGVMLEHRGLCNLATALARSWAVAPESRLLQFSSLSFDASMAEISVALGAGATLCLLRREEMIGEGLVQVVKRHRITHLVLPTQVLATLPADARLESVKALTVAGEAFPGDLAKRWAHVPRLINGYGPTETTVCATEYVCPAEEAGNPPIGKPLENAKTYILDANLQPLPIGIPGELFVGGVGVARGYWNRPELTAERFLPDPFATDGESRMYRTGDLTRWRADGNIEYLGRNDFQIKIRGFRVELGEIEARLAEHPAVREAIVTARGDTNSDKRLVAYYTPSPGQAIVSADQLRAHLAAALPDHMVPAAFVRLKELPLTPNGKLDRKALPAPDADAYSSRAYEPPKGKIEMRLAEIWSDLLRVKRVGRHDNFFELGGHSLLAVSLMERMRRSGLAADVRTLFASPTVASLAAAANTATPASDTPPNLIAADCQRITPEMLPLCTLTQEEIDSVVAQVPGGVSNVQDIYPLAPLQEGIFFLHMMESEGDTYISRWMYSFDTRDHLDQYLEAMRTVTRRHDILRTAILWEGLPAPVQVVWRQVPPPIEELHFEGGDVAEQLFNHFDPHHFRMDVRQAPLTRFCIAHDPQNHRWLYLQLLHHLAGDHVTLEATRAEIKALLAGQGDRLPPPPPFRNLVAQARLGVTQQEHEAFFRAMLADVEETTAPFGLVDVQGDGTGIEEARISIDPALAGRLRSRARKLGVSAASLFHLAWALVVASTSGRQDVVFGTVLFGRMQGGEGFDRMMGLIINTLPVRVSLGTESASACVRKLHGMLADLLQHEHASLALAQRCSAVPAPAPLFSSILNYRHSTGIMLSAEQAPPGMQTVRVQERTNYPVLISVDDHGRGFSLEVQAPASVGPLRICEFMRTALESLTEALETSATTPVAQLNILPDAERELVLHNWNKTTAPFPSERGLHELIEEQVMRSPDIPAVVFGDTVLTYRDLNERSNQLAHCLRGLGAQPDARVAISMERSLEMVVGLVAILKSGAAYVPLQPTYPVERLRFMLADAAPVALLTQTHLRELFTGLDLRAPILDLAAPAPRWRDQPLTNPDPKAIGFEPHHLAYVIYTSGSTGTPKGVLVPHRAVVNRLVWMQETYGLQPGEAVLQKTPFGFDVSVWEFFWTLMTGATLVMAQPEGHKDPAYLAETIRRHQVTTLHFVPSMLQIFLEHSALGDLSSLRRVFLSGEALPASLLQLFQKRLPTVPLYNLYGPTEAAVDVTAWSAPPNFKDSAVPIGKPVSNTQMYILNGALQPVPIGVAGELYIGGVQVARGYLNRAELTAQRFLPDPFSGTPDARMYRTGDLARWRQDGNIEYLGRNDFQVKIRGFRIELGEIESRLAEHPAVRDAVVIARQDAPGNLRLVAYYTAAPDNDGAGAEQFRAHLSTVLPDYMVPAAYVRLEALPLTPNGKLDRKALPAPETDAFSTRSYEAPQGEIETRLAEIWSELLGVHRVGRHDNFFELGGHSLLAITLMERMRRSGIVVGVRTLFDNPTIAALAPSASPSATGVQVPPNLIPDACQKITPAMLPLVKLTQEEIDGIVAQIPGGTANVQDIYPLAPLQEGMLFHHMMQAEGDPYLSAVLYRFDSRNRLDRYLQAMQAVIDRHDILRTAILWEGLPEPVQVVCRHASLNAQEVQFENDGGDAASQLFERYHPRHYRFDVRQAPLQRYYIARDPQDDSWLLLQLLHHLADDRTTLELTRTEMQAFLTGAGDQLPAPLPFRNLVAQARLSAAPQEEEAFFRKMLGDIEEPTAPFGLLDVQNDGSGIEEVSSELDPALASRLRSHARRLAVSTASLFHLAWAMVLARASTRQDVVFGTVLFGRMQGGEGFDRLMGLFINTLPIRISIRDEGAEAAVRDVHARLADLLQHEHASLAVAQRCSGVPAPAPLFSAILNYRHTSALISTDTGPGEGRQTLRVEERTNYPIMLSVNDRGAGFSLDAQAPASTGPMRICELMQTALVSLVQALENSPQAPVSTLEVLPASERHLLLQEWNDTAAPLPEGKCVQHLFEEQVARTPEALAVSFEGDGLTYAELNRRANRLAHYLAGIGVGPEVLIGVCLERSLDLVVSLMAILKTGAAYLPLDPAFPSMRLSYMVEDSRIPILLTHRGLEQRLPSLPAQIVRVDKDSERIAACSADAAGLPAHAGHNRAYVLYTSGSTGKPKGVEVLHQGLMNFLLAMQHEPGFRASDVMLAETTLSFDIAGLELYLPLITGGHIVLVSSDVAHDAVRLMKQIAESGCTVVQATPAGWRGLIQAGWKGSPQLKLLCGGEAMSRGLADELLERSGEVWNMYGPTETTVWSAVQKVSPGNGAVPIGKPIANLQYYILDSQRALIPAGAIGELYIGGVGVGRGYLYRDELNRERFVPNPFLPGTQMYRSGDLARWRNDGTVEYLGRNDFQVKVRGFRIELGEIEARLAEHPAVVNAVVTAREDVPGDTRLVAYYTPAMEKETPSAEQLRSHLAAALPDYMVPAAYVCLQELPLTPAGKVDRKALPAPEGFNYSSSPYDPPQGEMETELARIWAEVLRVDRVGRHDNFFDLGGHSLLALQFLLRLQKILPGEVLPLRAFLEAPTVARFAAWIRDYQVQQRSELLVNIQPGSSTVLPLFCVHASDGNPLGMQPLARALEPDVPFYALLHKGLDGSAPFETVEEAATCLLQEVRQVQPHGPYRLSGYCFGGVVAYEMAHMLEEAGEPVSGLFLIDASNPAFRKFKPGVELFLRLARFHLHRAALHTRKMISLRPRDWFGYVGGRMHALYRHLSRLTQLMMKPELRKMRVPRAPAASGTPLEVLVERVKQAGPIAARKYVPKPFRGSAVVFRASERDEDPYEDLFLGWKSLVQGNLQSFEIDGDHKSLFYHPELVKPLARIIQAQLDKAPMQPENAPAVPLDNRGAIRSHAAVQLIRPMEQNHE